MCLEKDGGYSGRPEEVGVAAVADQAPGMTAYAWVRLQWRKSSWESLYILPIFFFSNKILTEAPGGSVG